MEKQSEDPKTGIVLMTYGSATTSDHVAEYFDHVYRGKASEELIRDFEERYRLVGHSPLVEITKKQAELLEAILNESGSGKFMVRAGMLHSEPFIEKAVRELGDAGTIKIIGIILSPQFSSFIMDGYRQALMRATEQCNFATSDVAIVKPWPTEPNFIALLADRIRASQAELEKKYGKKVPIIFTTHSLPQRVVKKDPGYLTQLQSTIDAVLKNLDDPALEWYAGYQSAGHTPEEWLKPDLTDILERISGERSAAGSTENNAVLIVPIQFLADHLEILYDLDIAGRKQCEDRRIDYHRIELPNTDPRFIKALANIALG